MTTHAVELLAAGDVFPNLPEGSASFEPLRPLLDAADIVSGNCEGVYSDRPRPAPSHKHLMTAGRDRGAFLGSVPFHVMTCANNHIVDGGYEGLEDTLALLREQGIAVTGAGPGPREAIEPAIVERGGLRVAFLAFCSVFPAGYEARGARPGLSALRIRTFYADPDPNFWEPGIAPSITAVPDPGDLAAARTAIAAARERADYVVVSCHWGYSSLLERLMDYELQLARDVIRYGADAVVCHHHHSLRGIEIVEGRPIYYGLGALIHHFHGRRPDPDELARRRARFGSLTSFGPSDEFPLYPFQPDARMTGLASMRLGPEGAIDAGFVPAEIQADGSTEPLAFDDPRARRVTDYVTRLSNDNELGARFEPTEWNGWMRLRVRAG